MRRVFSLVIAGIAMAAASALPPFEASGGEVRIGVGGGFLGVSVTSIKEARFRNVIKQQYDYSCGSAAVASLLTYHYEQPTTEQEVFEVMWGGGDKESIRRLGFSLLDMQRYLATRGYRSDGFRVPLDKLAETRVPAITLINTNGYKHFVLVKGLRGGNVLVGDPALGAKVIPRPVFERMWEGIVFVIRDKLQIARRHFDTDKAWAVRADAPFGTVMQRGGLGAFLISLPGPGEF